jgi:hypothetical protein
MSKKEIIEIDEIHRIIVDRERGKDSLVPFIVLIPQKKKIRWHNYHCIDFCQDFKYDYEVSVDYMDYDKELKELINYLPELDKIMIEHGGIL